MTELVGVMIDGELTVHAPGVSSDYDTLCGIDADDPKIGHEGRVPVHPTKFITCQMCYVVWKRTLELGLREKDFLPKLRC